MAKILVYNNSSNRMEVYYKGEQEWMPYNTNGTLKVKEFRGSSKSNILWTSRNTMLAWNSFRYIYGKPVLVGYAFKRTYEGGHSGQSQHYAGTAFDVGQKLTDAERNNLRRVAVDSGVWSYVEPISLTPTWVHMDKRNLNSACVRGGYPLIRRGTKGVYVLVAQDSLNTLGYKTGGLDGIFGEKTQSATLSYQRSVGLQADGIIGCNTWLSLQESVIERGETSTTIN